MNVYVACHKLHPSSGQGNPCTYLSRCITTRSMMEKNSLSPELLTSTSQHLHSSSYRSGDGNARRDRSRKPHVRHPFKLLQRYHPSPEGVSSRAIPRRDPIFQEQSARITRPRERSHWGGGIVCQYACTVMVVEERIGEDASSSSFDWVLGSD